jgi:hypothetical protein
MTNNLEQLKTIVFGGSDEFIQEDKDHVLELEKRLYKTLEAEKLASHEIIQDYISHMENLVEQADMLLKEDRTLTQRDRDILFERKDICDRFIRMFNGKEKEYLDKQIKGLIDAAKNLE